MDLGLEGRVAMITGGSNGLGKQAAQTLAREGCKVSICARGPDRLEGAVAEFRAQGYVVHGTQADVTLEADAHVSTRIPWTTWANRTFWSTTWAVEEAQRFSRR
jgi:NAD(P)-dependent dehydrogenase (short-subunit alcohol dehydrogenase family)